MLQITEELLHDMVDSLNKNLSYKLKFRLNGKTLLSEKIIEKDNGDLETYVDHVIVGKTNREVFNVIYALNNLKNESPIIINRGD